MDYLCKRYGGSSFFVLDNFISQQRFNEFIYGMWDDKNEEEIFNVWLHKIDDKSYQDFKNSLIPNVAVDETMISNIINESKKICTKGEY